MDSDEPRGGRPALWTPTLWGLATGLSVNAGPPLVALLVGSDPEAAWGLAWILAPLGGGAAAAVLAARLGSPPSRSLAIGAVGFLAAFFVASVLAYAFMWQLVTGGMTGPVAGAEGLRGILAVSLVNAGVGAILGLVFGRSAASPVVSGRLSSGSSA